MKPSTGKEKVREDMNEVAISEASPVERMDMALAVDATVNAAYMEAMPAGQAETGAAMLEAMNPVHAAAIVENMTESKGLELLSVMDSTSRKKIEAHLSRPAEVEDAHLPKLALSSENPVQEAPVESAPPFSGSPQPAPKPVQAVEALPSKPDEVLKPEEVPDNSEYSEDASESAETVPLLATGASDSNASTDVAGGSDPERTSPWTKELSLLAEIGFADVAHNVVLLHEHDGKIQAVINALINANDPIPVEAAAEDTAADDDWEEVSESNDTTPLL